MTVLCANCHTANRDRAMFCIGCAGKLPAFAATGPSALETVRGKQRPGKVADSVVPATRVGAPTPHAPRGLMMAVLLLGATVVALAAWISFGPERAAAPGLASAAAPPLQTLPATAVAAPAAVVVAPPPVQVPVESALSPGESTVPATASVATAPAVASAPPVAKPPTVSPTRTSTMRSAGDPRAGCEHLFFVLAARCEAEHCEQAAYARHPRCEAVRDQRRRDEARRNPTGG
jgi:hypothetical protein